MRSFKNHIFEVAEPKSGEEKRFKDQHRVDVKPHPVAPESQHKGVIKPKAKRRADQEGDANYDQAYLVKEAADTASPDESSMAMDQADFIAYVAREMKEHLKAGKEFPEWMQNKLSKLQQAAQDLHGNFGAHGEDDDDMKESIREGLIGGIIGGAAGMMAGTATGASSAASNALGNLASKAGKNMIQRGAYKAMGQAIGSAAPALAGAVVGSKAQDAMTKKKKEESVEEELKGGQKKLDHNKNGKIDAHDFHLMRKKKMKEEAEQIDEISQETLRQYHGKAGADLRAKRDKLDKGTLTTADLKKGQNRVKGLNRAADKMEEVELGETTNSAIKKPVNITGSDGKTRTVMKTTRANVTDDRGQDKIKTNESIDEAFKAGILKFADKSSMVVKKEDADLINKMMKSMSGNSRKKMEEIATRDKSGFTEILEFAKEAF